MKIGQIDPLDRKFWPKEPEPGFDPNRNKWVIESSIKKYEARRVQAQKLFRSGLAERTNAVATYLTGRYGAGRNRSLEKYFGRRYLAKLRGQQIISQLRNQRMGSLENLRRMVAEGKGFRVDQDNAEEKSKSKKKI